VSPGAAPTVTKISPTKGPASGGDTVVITGGNLSTAQSVSFGSFSTTDITARSATSVSVIAPEATAGLLNITVRTLDGTSATGKASQYTVGKPTVTRITPAHGPAAGGTHVVVRGTGFAIGSRRTTFLFGKALGLGVECQTTSECALIAPAGKADVSKVVAEVGKDKSSATAAGDQFEYE
jgi:hypothetical protein